MTISTAVPKPHIENTTRIADFVEEQCLRKDDFNISVLDVVRAMGRQDDVSDEDFLTQRVGEAFEELELRAKDCGVQDGRYPYSLSNEGSLLEARPEGGNPPSIVYVYLLLTTTMNMKDEKKQGGLDATAIFESLCKEVAVRYWGGPSQRVDGLVFGTGAVNNRATRRKHGRVFQSNLELLCEKIGEGDGYLKTSGTRKSAKDDKLDIAVWRSFSDEREGKLIGFGQCKTGRSWRNELAQLQPESFCKKWMRSQPPVYPVRLFFVSERVRSDWRNCAIEAGILFDRCRVVEYSYDLPRALIDDIRKWVLSACKLRGLTLP